MLNSTEPTESSPQTSESKWSNEVFSADATARRRVLLKGLGKGAAVLTATVPIQTLAGQICPSSGTMSARVSQGTAPAESCPSGFSAAYWGQADAQRPPAPVVQWPDGASPSARYNSVFAASHNHKTMFSIMSDASDCDEKHWICAWLNSKAVPKFPYSSAKVISLSNATFQSQYADALTFLKKYMESRVV